MYSQLGQDDWVLSVFPINNGFFVDIGYRHPINISNTYLLELNGWSGIGVDPLLSNEKSDDAKVLSIQDNLNLRPKTKLYNYAVYSISDLEIDFIKAGCYSGIKQCLYAGGRAMKKFKDRLDLHIKVKTKTLEDILLEANAPNDIHYLSLDTEGSEYEILKNFPFDKYKFGCITVEHNKNMEKKKLICDLLMSNGYLISKDRRHDFFLVHSEIDKIFNRK